MDAITAVLVAVAAVIGSVTTLLVALRPFLSELRKNTAVTQQAADIGQQNHVMINSQRAAAEAQQTRTDNALRSAGIPIPFNPAADPQVSGTE